MSTRRFCIAVAVMALAGFLGGAASNLLLRRSPVQDVVRTKRLEIVSGAGLTWATLGEQPNGVMLAIGPPGYPRAINMGLTRMGSPWLSLHSGGNISLGFDEGDPAITLDGGDAALSVRNDSPRVSLMAGPGRNTAGLSVRDAQGNERVFAGMRRPEQSNTRKPLLVLYGAAGRKAVWRAP